MVSETNKIPIDQLPIDTEEERKKRQGRCVVKQEFIIEVPPTVDDRDVDQQPKKKQRMSHKKNKGQNKPKDRIVNTVRDVVQLCQTVSMGNECTRDECKYSHDIDEYLALKGPDIGDSCPVFALLGKCRYGLKCRFAMSHTDEQKKPIEKPETHEEHEFVKNLKNMDQLKEIRSKTYLLSDQVKEWWQKRNSRVHGSQEQVELAENKDDSEFEDRVKLRLCEKKKIDFRGKTYLAPLTTVGNLPFRRICKGFGVDITCSEMALGRELLNGKTSEWALTRRHASEDFFGIQVACNFPDSYARCVQMLSEHVDADFIDLNLGCPVDTIMKTGCGSALMERKTKLRAMILGAQHVTSLPITVKLRTGVRHNTLVAPKFVPMFSELGVSAVTLHGRTTEQRYTKMADWDIIAQCSALAAGHHSLQTTPAFFGNGDVFSPQDYYTHLEAIPSLAGIMIGRGALIKPWIFQEIKERKIWDISSRERLDILKDYAQFGLEHWGSDTIGVNNTRRYLCEWLSYLYRYVPVGLLEVLPQRLNERPDVFKGRDELETLMASDNVSDWIKLTELVLGPAPESFSFIPKHKSNSYEG